MGKAPKALTMTRDDEGNDQIASYDPSTLVTFQVFTIWKGTVFSSRTVWIETVLFMTLMGVTAALILKFLPNYRSSDDLWTFLGSVSTMMGFILGFYVNDAVSRMTRMFGGGCGNIGTAMCNISMLINRFSTLDDKIKTSVLDAVSRYGRASMVMVFNEVRHGGPSPKLLIPMGLLTAEEVVQLEKWNNNLSETIWIWVLRILLGLHKQQKLKKPWMLKWMLKNAEKGRSAVDFIHGNLGQKAPYKYVHLLGLLVKIHNMMYCVCIGIDMAHHLQTKNKISIGMAVLRAFVVPFIYNSLMLVGVELQNPFNGDVSDLPMTAIQKGMDSDQKEFINMSNQLPDWFKRAQWKKMKTVLKK